MLRSQDPTLTDSVPRDPSWKVDIPISQIRHHLKRSPDLSGIIQATLSLTEALDFSTSTVSTMEIDLPARSSMLTTLSDLSSRVFPKPNSTSLSWMLDFGKIGIIMTQSRMLEIQNLINPNRITSLHSGLQFGTSRSWVDLLLNPTNAVGQHRYTATMPSLSSKLPAVKLTLTNSQEVGFTLGRLPVSSLMDVYRVLEIVKEQCWLNEGLRLLNWNLGPQIWQQNMITSINGTTGDQLVNIEALLNKTAIPSEILVGARINAFNNLSPSSSISLTIPTRSFQICRVEVAYITTNIDPIKVTVDGTDAPKLAEVARIGGPFAVCQHVWASS